MKMFRTTSSGYNRFDCQIVKWIVYANNNNPVSLSWLLKVEENNRSNRIKDLDLLERRRKM